MVHTESDHAKGHGEVWQSNEYYALHAARPYASPIILKQNIMASRSPTKRMQPFFEARNSDFKQTKTGGQPFRGTFPQPVPNHLEVWGMEYTCVTNGTSKKKKKKKKVQPSEL